MTTAAIAWKDGEDLKVAELKESSPNFIGRAPGSMVLLDNSTVSRQQALVRYEDGAYKVENLSTTNPTRLNDQPLSGLVPIKDGDVIKVGGLELTFHDLAASATISGPICSYCKRENSATDKDCWYCGTSLVNAPTTIKERLVAVCRVLSLDGTKFDIYPNQVLALKADGAETGRAEKLPEGTTATIEAAEGGLKLRLVSGEATINGEAAVDGDPLRSGDQLLVDGARYTLIAG